MTDNQEKNLKRSHLTEQECLRVFADFAKRVKRMQESTDGSTFGRINEHGISVLPDGQINVMFCVSGSFGVAENLFEAIRVMGGYLLPADAGEGDV